VRVKECETQLGAMSCVLAFLSRDIEESSKKVSKSMAAW